MLHSNVRRLTAAVALVLVLAAVPALAAPGHRPHATQAPVAGLSLLDRLLDWLGFPATEGLPGLHTWYQKTTSTTTTTTMSTTTPYRGVQIDPNGNG
jgi:hypothetical protein